MIKIISLLFILILSFTVFGQVKKTLSSQNYLHSTSLEDDIILELLPMPVGMTPNLTDAKIAMRYFGAKSEDDITFVLILKGSKSRYSTGQSFSVRLLIDDVPIDSSKYRVVESASKKGAEEYIRFHITTEELAWMATGNKLKIIIFNGETEAKLDTLALTPPGVAEIKKFAKAVYLVRSKFSK